MHHYPSNYVDIYMTISFVAKKKQHNFIEHDHFQKQQQKKATKREENQAQQHFVKVAF